MSFPKMVYKNEKTPIIQHINEVGYPHKVVHSEEELKALGSAWGEHPEAKKEEKPEKKEAKKEEVKEEVIEETPDREEVIIKGKRK